MSVRVLFVAPWGERAGGAEEMLWTLLSHLDREKIVPTVGFLSPGPFVEEVAQLGLESWAVQQTRLRDPIGYFRTVRTIASHLRRDRFDVIVSWSAKAHLFVGPAAVVVRRKATVLWWQHMIPDGHWLDRLATLVPADVVGCSSFACERGQRLLRPTRKTVVVHPGVEFGAASDVVKRELLGIPADAYVVGIVGRMQPWKGQDRVIRSVAELRARGVPAVALLVGGASFGFSASYQAELEVLSRELDIERHVFFTGHVADARPYYAVMDVVANASIGEPFGIVVVEAMAAGRPVVAFNVGGPPEIIESGETGILTPPEELSKALESLWGDQALARRIAENGREHALATFTAARAARELAAALARVAPLPSSDASRWTSLMNRG